MGSSPTPVQSGTQAEAEAGPAVSTTPGAGVYRPRRPGLVTFAAVVTFIVGALYVLLAITEFSNSYWFYNNTHLDIYDLASSHLLWWGIFDAALAVITISAGVSILRGGIFGLMLGIWGSAFSFLRWMFYIPHDPWLALTICAINALVLYGLCTSADFFAESGTS
jgi:hypothetical protein